MWCTQVHPLTHVFKCECGEQTSGYNLYPSMAFFCANVKAKKPNKPQVHALPQRTRPMYNWGGWRWETGLSDVPPVPQHLPVHVLPTWWSSIEGSKNAERISTVANFGCSKDFHDKNTLKSIIISLHFQFTILQGQDPKRRESKHEETICTDRERFLGYCGHSGSNFPRCKSHF